MAWSRTFGKSLSTKKLMFESLESRHLLSGDPLTFDFASELFVAQTIEEQELVDKVGVDLAWLHSDWVDWMAAGGEAVSNFANFSQATAQIGFAVQSGFVALEAFADEDAAEIASSLSALGFQEVAFFRRGITGFLPLGAIDDLTEIAGLNFVRVAYGSGSNAGSTNTQGDAAQRSDDARSTFGVTGNGITVGVISDSYDISASASGSAAQDIVNGDLPNGINILDDTRDPNSSIDEGRAMLQIVHDVAPGAGLAFHSSGISQVAMASGITDLRNAGADVIVDDVIFFAEPMFQDGLIAQAVDEVVDDGVVYLSSAGNQARRSYESAFNAGQIVNIGGVNETAHEFNPATDDILQRVTIPIGATFRLSFQWDSPFASAGGAGSANNLNIYLVSGNTIVAQGRTNNIGGDAVEIPSFFNNTSATQFDVLITSAGGALPGQVKYVDFSNNVIFNEYLTNSPTSYGHANAEGAIAVGAASFLSTPEFGTTPPTLESFSSLGGVPILFDTDGIRLTTPIVRQKTDVVGPDGVNTTFFGSDIAGDADAFPNFFGTSAAAPHVAGLAALMLETDATSTPEEIELSLERTAIDMDNPFIAGFQTGHDTATGWGLISSVNTIYNIFTPATPTLDVASNSGSTSDLTTYDTTPTIKATVPAGSFVRLYVDGIEQGSGIQLGAGITQFSADTSFLSNGDHEITIRVAESSTVPLSNMSNVSAALTITVDAGLPSTPPNPNLQTTSDSGGIVPDDTIDNVTKNTIPTFDWGVSTDSGPSGIAGYYWAIDDSTPQTGGTFVDAANPRVATPLSPLGSAPHNFYVVAVDVAGNFSNVVANLSFTVDTGLPSTPGPVNLTTASDTGGIVAGDRLDDITKDTTPTFEWTMSTDALSGIAGYYWAVDDSTPQTGGTFTTSLTATPSVPGNGLHHMYVVAVDVAGNFSTVVATLPFTIDTGLPSTPGLLNLVMTSDTGTNTSDDITSDTTPTFDWTMSTDALSGIAGYYWAVDDSTPQTGGTFTTSLTATPTVSSNNPHNMYVVAVDVAGNFSAVVANLPFTIDTIASTITDVKLKRESTNPWNVSFAQRVSLSTGSEQFRPIDDSDANTLEIVFSEHAVNAAGQTLDGSELTLHRSRRLSDGSVVNEVLDDVGTNDWTFAYDSNTRTGKWTFVTPLLDGKYTIRLDDSIRDPAGNQLDADWNNTGAGTRDFYDDDPQRSFQYNLANKSGIGDGIAGTEHGEFRFHFALLAGDENGDGYIDATNMLPVRAHDGADFNDDEEVDNKDLLIWQANYGNRWAVHADGDANGDQKVDGADLAIWQAQDGMTGSGLAADFDGSGGVTGNDFLIWQDHFGLGYGVGPEFGDANDSGKVGGTDLIIWQARYGSISVWSPNYLPPVASFTVGTAAPQVMNVIISGSMSTHPPFSFDTVDGSGTQLNTVPVGGADTISIVFSEAVNVSAETLFVVGLRTANLPDLAEFHYDPLTYTATWRFEGWALGDNYLLYLSDSITDTEGNFLDGDWTNPKSTTTTNSLVSEFPSGEGTPGGAFVFTMTLLAGDTNSDGVVDNTDIGVILNNFYGPAGQLFATGDSTGDGLVTLQDYTNVLNNFFVNLQTISILADFDADGDVDDDDLYVIYNNYGSTTADWEHGDLNGDAIVDELDIDLAFAQFGPWWLDMVA